MAKADLHVHSVYSEHPSEWFLKRLGAKESYTDPELIYRMARDAGMDFVTITDHNRIEGSLLLHAKHPADTFTGVEFTTYFPEDGCKVHILVYGLSETEFEALQKLRSNIYQFSEYLRESNLAHSVAHATYPVNGMITISHLERLLLLFDVFEGINGGRNRMNNNTWLEVLSNLSEERLAALSVEHGIETASDKPWSKGLTGGSDDHAGLFVGRTFTESDASTPLEFLDSIRSRRSWPFGRSNTYQSLVFSVYRIAYEFSRQKRNSASGGLVTALTDLVFEKKDFRLKERLFLKKLSAGGGGRSRMFKLVNGLIEDLRNYGSGPMESKLELVYARIADLSDEFMISLVDSIRKDISDGDLIGFASNSSASIPGIFLSLPFFTAVRDMFSNKGLLDALEMKYLPAAETGGSKRTLWFTDTFTDLNGVSVTLGKVAGIAGTADPGVRIVTALSPEESGLSGAENVINLPYVDSFNLPGYEKYVLKVPSVLKALDIIAGYEPDEIFISTPGPVGLVGLLMARLMSIRATGFFHTDYAKQATRIISDESVTGIIEGYVRWFYGCCDEVRIPTDEYISILRDRGYEFRKVSKFLRGIDTEEFSPVKEPRHLLASRFGIEHGPVLVYTGRISKEKNLEVAIEAYRRILSRFEDANFLIAGDGPHLESLKETARDLPRVRFLGRISNKALPQIYSLSDLFVFPSDTDTFGMSVLEAQACGLPAVVSSVGGPREIISDGVTGLVARVGDVADWTRKISRVLEMLKKDYPAYRAMCDESRRRVMLRYDWKNNYAKLFERSPHAGEASNGEEASFAGEADLETIEAPAAAPIGAEAWSAGSS